MSAGTKVFLAGAVIFVAVLVGYYGVFTPQPDERPTDPIATEPADEPDETPANAKKSDASRRAERSNDDAPVGIQHLVPARRGTRMTPSAGDAPDASAAAEAETTGRRDATADGGRATTPAAAPDRTVSAPAGRPRTPQPDARATTAAPSRGGQATPDRATPPAATESTPKPKPAATTKPPAARTSPPPAGSRRTAKPATVPYTIRSGDTLSSIAERHLGDARHWTLIARANPLVDPNRLKVGDVIRLPARAAASSGSVRRHTTTPPRRTTGTVKHHVVRSGETLSDIAYEHYGDSALWHVLYDANRPTIGTDPDTLEVGMRLVVPRKPRG